jgi:hypothetical protein
VVRSYAGINCAWPGTAAASEGQVLCARSDAGGYAVAVTHHFVAVHSQQGKFVYFRNRRTDSSGFDLRLYDVRTFHRETHRGITCYWTRTDGGGAGCYRADHRGSAAIVTKRSVVVLNEKGKVVFRRNQP